MALSPSSLAADIVTGLGQSSVTQPVTGFASGILKELMSSGVASTGLPTGNTISGMSASSMASKVAEAAGFGSATDTLEKFCAGVVEHIQSSAIVTYSGPTPPAAPIYFLGGTITGLSGSAMASMVAAKAGYPSVSSELKGMCNAICKHIVANGQVIAGVIS